MSISRVDQRERRHGRGATDRSLGIAVREVRLAKGLKLSEVAKAAHITASALSQIENGLVDPSLATLRQLGQALDVPVFAFLSEGARGTVSSVVVRADQRKRLRLPDSAIEYQLLSPNVQGRLEMLYFEVPVGAATNDAPWTHAGEECFVVLSGEGEMQLGGATFQLSEGDSATFSAELRHSLRNTGSVPLRVITTLTPPQF